MTISEAKVFINKIKFNYHDFSISGCAGHQRARSFVVDSDLLSNSISLAKKLLDQNQTSQVGNKMIRLISSLLVSADFCNEAAKLGIGEL